MTTPDQNEARREAIQSLGDVISELPGILHPYNTATAVYAAGWRPPLSTPEASDDERYEDSADYAGSVEWLRELGVVPVAAKMFLDDVIKSARRGPAPRDVEQAIKRLESRGFGERMDYFIGKQNGDALRLIFDAARRSPVPADTTSEGDFPCCDDGEHVPAEIAGDLFTATLNRAQWHRVDEALAAHGRNDAVWSQIAATKTALHPTPPELEREGDAASRVATPPEDVERVADLIRDGIRGERDDTSICVPVGDLKVLLAALAAVPADTLSEGASLAEAKRRLTDPMYDSPVDRIRFALQHIEAFEQGRARPTPPGDVAALQARIRQLEAERAKCDGGCDYNSGPEETCSLHGRPVAEVWEALDIRTKRVQELEDQVADLTAAALAAVPADGETEWAESLANDGTYEFTVSSDCDGSNEKRWMRTPRRVIEAGPWEPIPESEEQR